MKERVSEVPPWLPAASEVAALAASMLAAARGDFAITAAGLVVLLLATGSRLKAIRAGFSDSARALELAATISCLLAVIAITAYENAWPRLPAAVLACATAALFLAQSRALGSARARLETLGASRAKPAQIDSLLAVDTVVLNKTGTLTFGRLEVTRTSPMAGVSEESLLEAAVTALQPRASDPIVRSILDVAKGRGFEKPTGKDCLAGSREELEAAGVRLPKAGYAREGTTIWVAQEGRCAGSFAVDDVLRPETRLAIALFHGMKLRTVMLSEDDISETRYIGWRSSVSASFGNLSAVERTRKVEEMRQEGRHVAVAGDEGSDPALLAAADVPVVMGANASLFPSTLTLAEKNLQTLAEVFRLLRRFRLRTRVLAFLSVVLGVAGAVLVITGQIPPILGPVWGILASGLLAWSGGSTKS